jgi:hypothetical protein
MRYFGVIFLVLAFTASAQAGTSVDWSAYIETGPSKPLVRTTGPTKAEAAPAKSSRQRVARAGKTKASKVKVKVKARAKKKTRRK